jgi:predicted phosphodiesterase
MVNINHKWKRFAFVGCTHAKYICKDAWDAFMSFREVFKPHFVAHIGDAIDMTGLMAHGSGSGSDGDDLSPDVDTGLIHLEQMRPNVFIHGNHEDRAYKMLNSKNPTIKYAAYKICEQIEKKCQKIKCRSIPYSGIFQVYDLADMAIQHGVLFNEMAARDTAEYLCTNGKRRKAIFAHTHKTAIQSARNLTSAVGYNIGTLSARGSLEYAKNRRATLAWTQAWAWGYYNEELNQSVIYITQRNHDEVWHIPQIH